MEKQDDEEYEWEKQKEWGWVMDAGKKVVMAGVIISSAPVLLPPLLVVSALGFAVSLPSGVVLASYACTHKLMTKLLPPPPPPLFDYDYDFGVDDDDDYDGYGDGDVEGPTTAAEVKMSEDIKNQIEMRIELVEDENHEHLFDGVTESQEEVEMSSTSSSTDVIDPKIDGDKLQEGNGVNGGGLHSRGEVISEDKIWEKIDAIRVIVGFKAPKRSSYVEEVKALYLFTGIEPPTQDQSHLTHLNFLMSVIGVK
ncbi:hypothetical protein SASPL_139249 [Salvia splendens]|uniref:Uncharacterized protein n=1 Tax=Salvia splendens TaxID=180675 RepID=A0A8X8ZEW7_SALSN|nr:uncharacterized protein LOC121764555 [Salvia splendens]KAG6402371.1 hypothetical protein SASPL_139249 [Salvia splendens]